VVNAIPQQSRDDITLIATVSERCISGAGGCSIT
jgi:hypothetical protein